MDPKIIAELQWLILPLHSTYILQQIVFFHSRKKFILILIISTQYKYVKN